MLMSAYDVAVDHAPATGRTLGQRAEHRAPPPALGPAIEAVIGRRVRPISLRQVPPRRARAQNEKDAIQNPPIILPRPATRLLARATRQQRLDDRPLPIRQVEPSDHGHLQAALNQNRARPSTDFGYRT